MRGHLVRSCPRCHNRGVIALRPAVFVGSSAEGLPVARALQALLDHDCEVTVWSQGVFSPGRSTIESLTEAIRASDFAVVVVDADDVAVVRGESRNVARDNTIFELGMSTGHLGRERSFMVFDRTRPPDLPTDLLGVTPCTYQPHSSGNLEASLGAASSQILRSAVQLGIRQERLSEQVDQAARRVDESGDRVDRMVRLLARSRAVELDIIASQFAMLIAPERLNAMKVDLEDLLAELDEEL